MKTIIIIALLAANTFCSEKVIQNMLIVHLSDESIELPDEAGEYSLDEVEIKDEALKKALNNLDIKSIRRTVPSFKKDMYKNIPVNKKYFQITDLSLVYTFTFNSDKSEIIQKKQKLTKVNKIKFVEYTYKLKNTDQSNIPNDEMFNYVDNNDNNEYDFGVDTPGRQWGLYDFYVSNPLNRADALVADAWDYTTGSDDIIIGFVESSNAGAAGSQGGITDLEGRNVGYNNQGLLIGNSHSIATAGIAVANTNNDDLVAGVDWKE